MAISLYFSDIMKLSAEERNERIHVLLAGLIKEAKGKKDITYPTPFTKEEVETLFMSHIWGHREILLTILLARILDPKFKASEDFYACNPRSIYEKPIRELLRKNGIPHKKSGPLNVAKNSQKIDEVWAHNKRGDGMALVVAKLVQKIESVPATKLQSFALAFVQRYLLEAKKVAKLSVKVRPTQDPVFLAQLCIDLVINVPDGGATPQFLLGTLIECFNAGNKSGIKTTGHLDSVSTTNTTSKKPGDVIEEFPDSSKRIYEVTVKEFSHDRMIESYEAIKAFDKEGKTTEVYVICREQDAPSDMEQSESSYLLGTVKYQDLIYYFVDIFEWMQEKLLFMTIESRGEFYKTLVSHINEVNTSEKVKKYFSEWHQSHSV
jgi:hypothetical protein